MNERALLLQDKLHSLTSTHLTSLSIIELQKHVLILEQVFLTFGISIRTYGEIYVDFQVQLYIHILLFRVSITRHFSRTYTS